jgi:hypothetical protein
MTAEGSGGQAERELIVARIAAAAPNSGSMRADFSCVDHSE